VGLPEHGRLLEQLSPASPCEMPNESWVASNTAVTRCGRRGISEPIGASPDKEMANWIKLRRALDRIKIVKVCKCANSW